MKKINKVKVSIIMCQIMFYILLAFILLSIVLIFRLWPDLSIEKLSIVLANIFFMCLSATTVKLIEKKLKSYSLLWPNNQKRDYDFSSL